MIEYVAAVVASPWILPLLFVLCVVDAFLPPVPSESVLIALATLSVSGAGPPVAMLVPVAALGVFAGDQIAYLLGAQVPMDRWPWFRSPRGRQRVGWVRAALRDRGTALILAARFMPVARIAVTTTAGATGYPRRRFLLVTAFAAPAWAGFCVLLGLGSGSVLPLHPLAAAAVGVLAGALLGMLADRVIRLSRTRGRRRSHRAATRS